MTTNPTIAGGLLRAMRPGAAALLTALLAAAANAQGTPAPAGAYARLQGYIVDSLHDAPLSRATVTVEGTVRGGITDDTGHYIIDSVPPGQFRVHVDHPVLDTLGLALTTDPKSFSAGQTQDLDLTIPGPERLATALCSAPMRMRGPAAMVGFVRDPDTKRPAIGAKVQVVYYVNDLIGRKQLRTGEQTVDSTGKYRICGLAQNMSGKVQVFRNGVSSGEVPIEMPNGFLVLRAFSVASSQTVVEVKNDSGKVKRVALGSARVTGRVTNKKGEPLRDARVTLQGNGRTVISRPNGDFVLDSLPSGTQLLEVRRLGYGLTEVPVELSANAATATTVTMSDAVPLETVHVVAAAEDALTRIGYADRKKMGFGSFKDGNEINHASQSFSDVMRTFAGLNVQPLGDGRTYVITDTRSTSGCVNFWVDGTPWTTMSPGDIDQFVQPADLVAIEFYHGTSTPSEFTTAGQSSCATIVAWTAAKINTLTKRKSP